MSDLRRITARIGMMLGIGRIQAIRTDRGKGRSTMTAQVKMPETGEVRDDVPIASLYGVSSRPRAGADAVVVFVGGNRSAGMVVATSDGRFTIELGDGEVALHTHDGTHVHLQAGGNIAIKAATEVKIDTPNLKCTGEIIAMCDGAFVRLSQHKHPTAAVGAPSSPTSYT